MDRSDPPGGSSLESLLQRVAARDRAAFAELFDRMAPRIAGVLARGGLDPGVRDELVQEVMLRVWRRADQFDPRRASATAWLFTIARNARIDHLRRPAVRARVESLDPAWVDAEVPLADDEVAQRQLAEQVRDALGDLPEEQAQILRAAYYEHKTLRAIATEGGLALGTVKSRVRLAFQRLRGMFGRKP